MKRIILCSVLVATAALSQAVLKVSSPTIDGSGIDATNYDLIATQAQTTSCYGTGMKLNALYMAQDATSLYIGITGQLTGGAVDIFLDTKAGGASNVATNTSGGYDVFDDLSTGTNGIMPSGFLVDYVINMKGAGTATDTGLWDVQANTAAFKGNNGSPNPGYGMAINNSGGADQGIELKVPKADVGIVGSPTIKIFVIDGDATKGGNPATYFNNQLLPTPAGLGTGCLGNDGAAGSGGNGLNFDGSQAFATVAPSSSTLPVTVSKMSIE